MDYPFVVLFATALVVTFLSMPVVRRLGTVFGLLDHPSCRKMQQSPVPRTGGIAILLGLGAGTALMVLDAGSIGFPLGRETLAVATGALLVHLIGVLDDLWDLPAPVKLVAQTVAVGLAMSQGLVIDRIVVPGGPAFELGPLAVPLTAFFLLGFINSINLIDGLDGLAAGVTAVGAFALGVCGVLDGNAVLAGTSALLAGAVCGFLPWNFRRGGKTFLGDAGSMLLGYSLGVTAIAGARFTGESGPLWIVLAASVFPILDTATTIMRRSRRGQGLFRADSMHIHHRMIRFGFTQRRTVLMIVLATLFAAAQALVLLVDGTRVLLIASTLAAGLVIAGLRRAERPATPAEADPTFREIVSYLLGARDGHTARMRGDLSLVDVVGNGDRSPAGPSVTPKIVPIHVAEPVSSPAPVEIVEEVPVK